MKKLLFFIFFASVLAPSQVSIGTASTNASAILDVDVSLLTPKKKGFLLPRVTLLSNGDVATIKTPAPALMVYSKANGDAGSTLIKGKSIAVWDSYQWQKFSSIPEIMSLKIPIHYVVSSKTVQKFTAANLTSINTSPSTPIEISWAAGDVAVDNPNDVALTSNSLKIITPSYYQFSGMLNFRANVNATTYGAGATTGVTATIQVSANGVSWSSIAATTLPFERYAASRIQTITFPTVIRQFKANDLIRIVVTKIGGANPFDTDSGAVVSAEGTDIVKSFRLRRIEQ